MICATFEFWVSVWPHDVWVFGLALDLCQTFVKFGLWQSFGKFFQLRSEWPKKFSWPSNCRIWWNKNEEKKQNIPFWGLKFGPFWLKIRQFRSNAEGPGQTLPEGPGFFWLFYQIGPSDLGFGRWSQCINLRDFWGSRHANPVVPSAWMNSGSFSQLWRRFFSSTQAFQTSPLTLHKFWKSVAFAIGKANAGANPSGMPRFVIFSKHSKTFEFSAQVSGSAGSGSAALGLKFKKSWE